MTSPADPRLPGFPEVRPDLQFSGHGWLNEENRRALARFVGPDTRVIVEVGTWQGLSARYMCDLAPSATLYAVDHWEGSTEHLAEPEWAAMLPGLWERFVVDCWDYRSRIVPVRCDSAEGVRLLYSMGVSPDVVYLDGGHGYERVTLDIIAIRSCWPDARLVGDDWGWEGVRRAATELLRGVQSDGNCWWV